MLQLTLPERDGVLVFQQEAVYVNETDGMVDICVQVDSITGTVETPFQVDVTLANGTAGKNITANGTAGNTITAVWTEISVEGVGREGEGGGREGGGRGRGGREGK